MHQTPGPWHMKPPAVGTLQPSRVFGPTHADGGEYAPLCELRHERDARLIAAAPELYDACKAALAFIRLATFGAEQDEMLQLERAIRKANGQ